MVGSQRGNQPLDLHMDDLAKADCGKVFTESAGGALVGRASFDLVAARSTLTGQHLAAYVGA